MHHSPITANDPAIRQNRLRTLVKRLVIELGYLEYCLDENHENLNLQTAALSLDTAIDCLNEHLVA